MFSWPDGPMTPWPRVWVVKAFNNEDSILDRWEVSAKEREHLGFQISKLMSLTLFNAFELLRTTVQLSIIFYYTYSEFNGFNLISAANILIFIFYSTSILNEITLLTNNLNAYTMAKGAAPEAAEGGAIGLVKEVKSNKHGTKPTCRCF